MSAMALNPRGLRSFVRLMKLPAALLTRPVNAPPSAQICAIMSSTASATRMSQATPLTVEPVSSEIFLAVSSSTDARRPQM